MKKSRSVLILMHAYMFLTCYGRKCPIAGCPGRSMNLYRYISQCHWYLTKEDRNNILKKYEQLVQMSVSTEDAPPETKTKPDGSMKCLLHQCCVCDKNKKRLDAHAEKVDLARRKSSLYNKIMRDFLVLTTQPKNADIVKVSSGKVTITLSYGLKSFMEEFEKYMKDCSLVRKVTAKACIRNVMNILKFMIKQQVINFKLCEAGHPAIIKGGMIA